MAYGQNTQRSYSSSNSNNSGARGAAAGGERKFEEDPNQVGIAYEKESEKIGKYLTVTVQKDIPAGTKLAIFENNKVKNRTDKTPTHLVKLSVKKS